MPKQTISDIDKKVAVLEAHLKDHIRECSKLSELTLAKITRIEALMLAGTTAVLGLLVKIVFFT
jgi:hypothetical protein|tara:strand:+ start:5920 stop:6111 length:192 start_codon:yes stop_codon:yes gene_type:complete